MTARRFHLLLARFAALVAPVLAILASALAFAAPAGAYSIEFSPSEINFGDVPAGQTKQIAFTAKNTGTTTFRFNLWDGTNGFVISQPDGDLSNLQPGETRNFVATFSPTDRGDYTQDARLELGPGLEYKYLRLIGKGTTPPDLVVSENEIEMNAYEGGPMPVRTYSMTNVSSHDITIYYYLTTTNYFFSGLPRGGTTLAPGGSITFRAELGYWVRGSFSESVSFATSVGTREGARIYGVVSKPPKVIASPAQVDLGGASLGDSLTTTVTLKNTGDTTEQVLPPTSSNAGSNFTFVSDMTTAATLAPGAQKQVTLTYSPQVSGQFSDSVVFATASGSTSTRVDVALRGIPRVPKLEVTPTSLALGNVPYGTIATQTVTVKNTGDAGADVGLPTPYYTSDYFSLTSDVLTSFHLEPGEERQVTLGLSWTDAGEAVNKVVFSTTDGAVSTTVDVSAFITDPNFTVASGDAVDFGATVTGSTSHRSVTVDNAGNIPITIESSLEAAPALPGADSFGVASASVTIPRGETARIPVTFSPASNGARGAILRLSAPGTGLPDRLVRLSGKGIEAPTTSPTFTASTVATPSAVPTEVVAGDFNGDGDADVAAGFAATGRIAIALGNGNGTFGAFTTVVTEGPLTDLGLAAADVDGDGSGDLAVADANGTSVYRKTSSGYGLLTAVSTAKATDVRFDDMNADGIQDLVVLDGDGGYLTYYLGDGAAFTNAGKMDVNGQPREFELVENYFAESPAAVVSDSEAAGAKNVQIFSQVEAGPFDIGRINGSAAPVSSAPQAVAAGHFNRDGAVDLTTGDSVLLGATDLYSLGRPTEVVTGVGGEAIGVADFDGDGLDDQVLASSAAGKVSVQRSIGGGTFGDPTEYPVTVASSAAPADIATADFNGDRRPDVVASSGAEGLTLLMNDGTFTQPSGVGKAVIEQFRPGTSGSVTVHNPSRTDTVRLGGWQLHYAGGATYTIPRNVQLPPRASKTFGFPNLGFSPDGDLTIGETFSASILGLKQGATGVALFDPADDRVDAVGLTTAPDGYREGAGLTAVDLGVAGVFARQERDGGFGDTNDNAADFVALNPAAAQGDGTVLGVPGWKFPYDATNRNDILQSSLYDASKSSSQAPNRERVGDELIIRRRITNCSGGLTTGVCVNADPNADPIVVTRLLSRITALSTIGNSSDAVLVTRAAYVPESGEKYDLDARTSTALKAAGVKYFGIGASVDLSDPDSDEIALYPGQSISVEFHFDILRAGKFTFGYTLDDDFRLAKKPTQTPEVGTPADTPAAGPSAPLVIPPASAAAPDATSGTVAAPINVAAAQAALAGKPTSSKPAAKAKCLTKAQLKRLKPKQRKKALACKGKPKTTKATGKRPSSKKTPSATVTNSTSKKGTR